MRFKKVPVCEKCWSDAYWISVMHGGSQPMAYSELLRKRNREGNKCTPKEQTGEYWDEVGGFDKRRVNDGKDCVGYKVVKDDGKKI